MRPPDWTSDDGAIRLYCGDCLELLPTMEAGSIDAVVTDGIIGHYEQATSRQCDPQGQIIGSLECTQDRHHSHVPPRRYVTAGSRQSLQHHANRNTESDEATRDKVENKGKIRTGQWAIQAWDGVTSVSKISGEAGMLNLRGDRKSVRPSQERKSFRQSPRESRGSVHVMPQSGTQASMVGRSKIVLITDIAVKRITAAIEQHAGGPMFQHIPDPQLFKVTA